MPCWTKGSTRWSRPCRPFHPDNGVPPGVIARSVAVLPFIALLSAGPLLGQDSVAADPGYAGVAASWSAFAQEQMGDKDIPGLSVALVDDQRIVWARGFGVADPDDST